MSENKTHLSNEFEDTSGAPTVHADFVKPKIAVGEVLILENERIEPSEEEKKKKYGVTPDMLAALPDVAVDAHKKQFIEEQGARLGDARNRTIDTFKGHIEDADNALIEVRDIAKDMLTTLKMLAMDNSSHSNMISAIEEGASAEVALDSAFEETIASFLAMNNPYFKKTVEDIVQVRATMQHHLHPDKKLATLDNLKPNTILVAREIPLHALSSFKDHDTGEKLVSGIITNGGSLESHAAILIGSMGIPYARVSDDDDLRLKNDDVVVMDGKNERLILHPSKAIAQKYEGDADVQQLQSERLLKKSGSKKSVKTMDGEKVNIHANFAISDETDALKEVNPVGIGLYRTEITALMRYNQPQETFEVKAEDWKRIIKHNMSEGSSKDGGYIGTTIRTIDLAGDKSDLDKEKRADKQDEQTLKQLTALALLQKDLEEEGHKNKFKVMIPMISSNEEMQEWQSKMNEATQAAETKEIILGCMVEVPALLTELDSLKTGFMSVGSNDLIHSLLGVDRYDEESIKKYEPTNPAVLKALEHVANVGAEKDIDVSICGDMASHPKYTAVLIGAGFRNMSAGIDSVPAVKEMVSRIDVQEAENLCEALLNEDTRVGREYVLQDFNEHLGLSAEGELDMNWKPSEDTWEPAPE